MNDNVRSLVLAAMLVVSLAAGAGATTVVAQDGTTDGDELTDEGNATDADDGDAGESDPNETTDTPTETDDGDDATEDDSNATDDGNESTDDQSDEGDASDEEPVDGDNATEDENDASEDDAADDSEDAEDSENATDANETDGDAESAATAERVHVELTEAPNGLQSYSVTVDINDASNATVEGVEGQLLSSTKLQVINQTDRSITFRAADLGDSVGPLDETRTLADVDLSAAVSLEDVSVTVQDLSDDAGNQINESNVHLRLNGQLFLEPLPGSEAESPPADPNGDGLYEDVDGDGDADFDDAIALAFVDHDALTTEQAAALDFDGDGDADFDDAIELAFQV